jgi:nitroimidazol reductase NimA-like FMN-containing flavoprotein (pyridoxamine 5'-phosphate oxidase superfamily)
MVIVKLPKMSESEIRKALSEENICRIAFIDGEFPYISPFQYVYIDDILYFHFTDYGKKKAILSNNRNVCVSIEKFEKDLSSYFFISIQGKLIEVKDIIERERVIKQMLGNARNNYSTNFLSAHGFTKERGWDIFFDETLIFYKLGDIRYRIGLKSI